MQHPEEGEIHSWLDGQSTAEQRAAIEQHIADCASCAARVAEARGLVAASSRILSALDNVPSGVIPERTPLAVPPPAAASPPRRRRFFDLTIARAAVALLAVGAGTFAVTRVADTPTRSVVTSAISREAITPAGHVAEADQATATNQATATAARDAGVPAMGAVAGAATGSSGRGSAEAPVARREMAAAAAPAPSAPAPSALAPPALADAREERAALPAQVTEPTAAVPAPLIAQRSDVAAVSIGEGAEASRLARSRTDAVAKQAVGAAGFAANANPLAGCFRLQLEPPRYLDLRLTELPEERDPAVRVLFLRGAAGVERARWSQLAADSVLLDLARTSFGSVISGRLTGDTIAGVTTDKREVKAVRVATANCGR